MQQTVIGSVILLIVENGSVQNFMLIVYIFNIQLYYKTPTTLYL